MLPLAHIILHLGLCRAIAQLPSQATFAVSVRMTDRTGRTATTKRFQLDRDDDPYVVAEYDHAFGTYRIDIAAPKYRCAVSDFLTLVPGLTRTISETLSDTPTPPRVPMLLQGTSPQSFLYVDPTFVLFDKNAVACNKPLPAPLSSDITVENDQDGYYVSLYNDDSSRAPGSELLALRLRTPTHQYHYVRIPMPFPVQLDGWPGVIQFNVTQDMVDGIATDPVNTLLCPRLWETSTR